MGKKKSNLQHVLVVNNTKYKVVGHADLYNCVEYFQIFLVVMVSSSFLLF